MASKENKQKKREAERREMIRAREERFKKNGIRSMLVIFAGAIGMFIVAFRIGGTVLGKNLVIVLGIIVGIAFVWSVVNASIRIRQMREERDEEY